MMSFPETFRSLRHRNYRRYFVGQLISLFGTWMQQIAMSWLVYRLTGSIFMLGVAGFAGQIPILLLAPLGGVLSDRFDRRVIMLVTQTLALVQALLLAILTLTDLVTAWQLIALAFCLGVINAVDTPARQAFIVKLVEDRIDLSNAIALNSMTVNSARFIGPSIGGLVVGAAGEGVCFLLNSLSYLAVIVALLAIRTHHETAAHHSTSRAMLAGFSYAGRDPTILRLLLLVASVSFFITPYTVLMPYFAREAYGGDAGTLGFLLASAGLGALFATLYLASRNSVDSIELALRRACLGAPVALLVFAVAGRLPFAGVSLFFLGFCIIATVASGNTLIQSMVKEEMRGRVMSLFTMSFLGLAPLGSLFAGWVASRFGARATLAGCAVAAFCFAVVFLLRHEQSPKAAA